MPHPSTISPSALPPISKHKSLMAPQRSLLVAVPKSRMSRPMEMEAIQTAVLALTQQQPKTGEKDVAKVIKKHFDTKFGPNWHCVVGGQFGCFVSHLPAEFVHFYVGHVAVLLFRTMS